MSGYNEKYPFLYCNGNEQKGSAVWLYNIKHKGNVCSSLLINGQGLCHEEQKHDKGQDKQTIVPLGTFT